MGAAKSSPKIISQICVDKRDDTPFIVSDSESSPSSPFQNLDINENFLDSDEKDDNSYLFIHPPDFILTANLLENKFIYTDYNKTKILSNQELQILFRDSFNKMIDFSELNGYLPSVITNAIQIVIRIFELKDRDLRTFSYLTAISYKFSVQLEYSDSLFENINDVVRMFKMDNLNKKLLVQMEMMILSLLKYDLIKDTIYLWLSIEQRQMLIDNKQNREKYYNFISNQEIYLRSSKENAVIFLDSIH